MNKDLGLDRGNLVYTIREGAVEKQYGAFRQELLEVPGVESVSASSGNPLSVHSATADPTWEGKDPDDDKTLFHLINVELDLVETMRMELIAGRSFRRKSQQTRPITSSTSGDGHRVGKRESSW